jgi:hypothetical protein
MELRTYYDDVCKSQTHCPWFLFLEQQTWTFELATKTWSQIAVVKNIEKEWVPPGRWMHSAVTINKGTNE